MIRLEPTTCVLLALISISFYYLIQQGITGFSPEYYSLPAPPKLEGLLKPNTKLSKAEHLLEGYVLGPESLVVEKDAIYTGTYDAKIIKIVKGEITNTVLLKPENALKCTGKFEAEPFCGRPLGIRRFDKDRLVVADAYLGIFLVNVEEDKVEHILESDKTEVDGEECSFHNDVEVFDNDTVIFSCSSSRWGRRHAFHILLEQKNDGRVYRYTISTKNLEVIAKGLRFPNGVQLTKDKSSLLISETGMARIHKLSLTDPAAQPKVLIENLPGMPDNIRETPRGTYLVGLAGHRSNDTSALFDRMGPHPWLRQAIIQIIPEQWIISYMPKFQPQYGFVIEFNEQGKIVDSFQDPKGKSVNSISEAVEFDGYIYMGSFKDNYIAKVKRS
uniref:Strictosidine synthase conserved region domain-containing protein n=1 Tax=Panagrolaimus superbus TaxID=310955 RepID=A0A914Z3M0_9BILA